MTASAKEVIARAAASRLGMNGDSERFVREADTILAALDAAGYVVTKRREPLPRDTTRFKRLSTADDDVIAAQEKQG